MHKTSTAINTHAHIHMQSSLQVSKLQHKNTHKQAGPHIYKYAIWDKHTQIQQRVYVYKRCGRKRLKRLLDKHKHTNSDVKNILQLLSRLIRF